MSKKNNITRVCIVDTVYTLFVYLLYSSEDELRHTFYFFSSGVAQSIREKLDNHFYIKKIKGKKIHNILHRNFIFFTYYIFRYFRWSFLRTAQIFGHDHLEFSAFIIGKRNYTYIEDGPKVLSVYQKNITNNYHWQSGAIFSIKHIVKKILNYLISGIFGHPIGNNKQCEALILTLDDNAHYISGKIKRVIPLNAAWKDISENKKQYIYKIYDLTENDIAAFQSKTHIILAQQFSSDGYISDADQFKIYEQIIQRYDPSVLILKPHPRDSFNYKKYFPNICVFSKPIPMQLLVLVGCSNFRKAITVCSSSINFFPDTVEKEWIGSFIHPVLYKLFPNLDRNIYE